MKKITSSVWAARHGRMLISKQTAITLFLTSVAFPLLLFLSCEIAYPLLLVDNTPVKELLTMPWIETQLHKDSDSNTNSEKVPITALPTKLRPVRIGFAWLVIIMLFPSYWITYLIIHKIVLFISITLANDQHRLEGLGKRLGGLPTRSPKHLSNYLTELKSKSDN